MVEGCNRISGATKIKGSEIILKGEPACHSAGAAVLAPQRVAIAI